MNKIPEELKDDELYMELVEDSKKYDLSDFREGFAFFQETLQKQIPDFPTKKVVEIYQSLFDVKGITIFERVEKLPITDQNNYYIYFYNETIQIGKQLLWIMAKVSEAKDKKSEFTKLLKVVFGGKNADILMWYWREWELQYFAFVYPVYKKLRTQKTSNKTRLRRGQIIDYVKTIIRKNNY